MHSMEFLEVLFLMMLCGGFFHYISFIYTLWFLAFCFYGISLCANKCIYESVYYLIFSFGSVSHACLFVWFGLFVLISSNFNLHRVSSEGFSTNLNSLFQNHCKQNEEVRYFTFHCSLFAAGR